MHTCATTINTTPSVGKNINPLQLEATALQQKSHFNLNGRYIYKFTYWRWTVNKRNEKACVMHRLRQTFSCKSVL